MPEFGDIIPTRVRFADDSGSKIMQTLVLFEQFVNVVIAGITRDL
jgi:hypothetical protein